MRVLIPALTGFAAFCLLLPAAPAQAQSPGPASSSHEAIHQLFSNMEALADRLADKSDEFTTEARQAIILGGAVVAQNRNTIAGGALGCAVGAALAASSAAMLGVPTGGASAAVAPNAMAAGCALGTAGGAALGYPLDHPNGP